MKHFLIKYRFQNGSPEDWHREIKRFIAALDSDPACAGKISYRCMKAGDCCAAVRTPMGHRPAPSPRVSDAPNGSAEA